MVNRIWREILGIRPPLIEYVPLKMSLVSPDTMDVLLKYNRYSGIPTAYCPRKGGGYDLWPIPEMQPASPSAAEAVEQD